MVIGAHTPEFAFKKDVATVERAANTLGIAYPIVIGNDFGLWRTFKNQAWPALYVIEADGRLRHRVLGEGNYDRTERWIQDLLLEANGRLVGNDTVVVTGRGPHAAADHENQKSTETYLGYAQTRNFASPGGIHKDTSNRYLSAAALSLDRWCGRCLDNRG